MPAAANVPSTWIPEGTVSCHDGSRMPADAVFPVAPPASIGEVVSAYTPYYAGQGPLTLKGRLIVGLCCGGLGALAGCAYEFFSGPLAKASFFGPACLGFLCGALFGFVFSAWEARVSFVGAEGFADFELDPKTFGVKVCRIVNFKNYCTIQTTSYKSDTDSTLHLNLTAEETGGAKVTLLTDAIDGPQEDLTISAAHWRSPEQIRPAFYSNVAASAAAYYQARKSLEGDWPLARCPSCHTHGAMIADSRRTACKQTN